MSDLSKVFKSLRKFGKEAEEIIKDTTLAIASEIEADAKRLAPVDMGFLRNQIHTDEVNEYNYEIVARAKYSAYLEFGTGGLVNVPEELKELAIKFKGKGVRQVNIMPQPFLYPAFVKGRKQYLKDLQDGLDSLTSKYN